MSSASPATIRTTHDASGAGSTGTGSTIVCGVGSRVGVTSIVASGITAINVVGDSSSVCVTGATAAIAAIAEAGVSLIARLAR